MKFPDTKYMGSKQALLPFITNHLSAIQFDNVLDAFSGSACVSYELKKMGKRVVSNDFLKFASYTAKATIENNSTHLTTNDLAKLLKQNKKAKDFIRKKFSGLYFPEKDCAFLDNISANIRELKSPLKKSLAMAALCRACMKKRPRGIFTFVGKKGWDGRRDLKLSMQEQFIEAVNQFNSAVFSNKQLNRATCLDVFDTNTNNIDLVYIDTPYMTPHSDCDYTRRYHFVEGICSYWEDVEIQEYTKTKKIKSYPTIFKSIRNAELAFTKLFEHFSDCKIAVSYSSNCYPDKNKMVNLLKCVKKHVKVFSESHKYYFGNHNHKIGNNNNSVKEHLFIAT